MILIGQKKKFPKITLVSNACLLIEWNGKNILTDPWIIGPAISTTMNCLHQYLINIQFINLRFFQYSDYTAYHLCK